LAKSWQSSEAKSPPALDLERDLQVSLHDNSKTIFVNAKRETLARYLTQLQVFSFTAADLDVVRGMPEGSAGAFSTAASAHFGPVSENDCRLRQGPQTKESRAATGKRK
jgi:hypothetical protein